MIEQIMKLGCKYMLVYEAKLGFFPFFSFFFSFWLLLILIVFFAVKDRVALSSSLILLVASKYLKES